MADTGRLHDAFIDELRDAYDAGKQPIKALPKLARAPTSSTLRAAFDTHLQATQGQMVRLERVFASLDEKVRGKHCDGIAGFVVDGRARSLRPAWSIIAREDSIGRHRRVVREHPSRPACRCPGGLEGVSRQEPGCIEVVLTP